MHLRLVDHLLSGRQGLFDIGRWLHGEILLENVLALLTRPPQSTPLHLLPPNMHVNMAGASAVGFSSGALFDTGSTASSRIVHKRQQSKASVASPNANLLRCLPLLSNHIKSLELPTKHYLVAPNSPSSTPNRTAAKPNEGITNHHSNTLFFRRTFKSC